MTHSVPTRRSSDLSSSCWHVGRVDGRAISWRHGGTPAYLADTRGRRFSRSRASLADLGQAGGRSAQRRAHYAGADRVSGMVFRSGQPRRSEEQTSELQSLMRISYAVFCLKKKTKKAELAEQQ